MQNPELTDAGYNIKIILSLFPICLLRICHKKFVALNFLLTTIKEEKIMKKFGILLVLAVLMFNCKGQTTKESTDHKQVTKTSDSKSNPEVKVKVNKTYDDKGNIVRYDSVYSYVYKYPNGNVKEFNADSVINEFRRNISENFSTQIDREFYNRIFPNDSLLSRDFNNNDFFVQQFRNESAQLERMMSELDSMKNVFLKDYYKAESNEYAEQRHNQKL